MNQKKEQKSSVKTAADFEKLSFEVKTKKKPYFVVMTKREFQELCQLVGGQSTVYEMAETASNGGLSFADGTTVRAFVEGK